MYSSYSFFFFMNMRRVSIELEKFKEKGEGKAMGKNDLIVPISMYMCLYFFVYLCIYLSSIYLSFRDAYLFVFSSLRYKHHTQHNYSFLSLIIISIIVSCDSWHVWMS